MLLSWFDYIWKSSDVEKYKYEIDLSSLHKILLKKGLKIGLGDRGTEIQYDIDLLLQTISKSMSYKEFLKERLYKKDYYIMSLYSSMGLDAAMTKANMEYPEEFLYLR